MKKNIAVGLVLFIILAMDLTAYAGTPLNKQITV